MKNLPKLCSILIVLLSLCALNVGASSSFVQPVTATANVTAPQKKERVVYITRTGAKYHRDGCQYLRQSKIAINLKDAIAKGYEACKVCKP